MDINFGCFYRFGDSPRVFKCVGMCAPFDGNDGVDFVLVSEVKPWFTGLQDEKALHLRHWCNGNMTAFQAVVGSSILLWRSIVEFGSIGRQHKPKLPPLSFSIGLGSGPRTGPPLSTIKFLR